jgi:type II secretory pathway component HofQ
MKIPYTLFIILALANLCAAETLTAPKSTPEIKHSGDYPDAEIRTILRELADIYQINVVIPDTLRGTASVKLRDVTWEQAFDVLLKPIDWNYRRDGNVIVLGPNKPPAADKKSSAIDLPSAIGEMQASMSLAILKDKKYADALAEFHWNFYSALIKKGFTKEQAMQIVASGGNTAPSAD